MGLMGVGKMTVSEAEYLNYLTVEKNPEAYLENPVIRSYIDELAKREWNRLFGTAPWEAVIVAGSAKYLPYYLAAKARAKNKVLVDLDFLPYIHEKYPARWRKASQYLTGSMRRRTVSSWEAMGRRTPSCDAASCSCGRETRRKPGGTGILPGERISGM